MTKQRRPDRTALSRWQLEVGTRLRQGRHTSGLSMMKLGRDIGICYQIHQRYEAGTARFPADMAVKLAQRLNIDIPWLLGIDA